MHLPKGPQTPVFVQVLRWVFSPMSFLEDCAKRYGDIFSVKLAKDVPAIVFLSNPKDIQQILTNDNNQLDSPGDWNDLFEPLLGKRSVITLSGAEHQRQRQLLMPPFHGERMRGYRSGDYRCHRKSYQPTPDRSTLSSPVCDSSHYLKGNYAGGIWFI